MFEEELDLFEVAEDAGLLELAHEGGGGVELELSERLERARLHGHHLARGTGDGHHPTTGSVGGRFGVIMHPVV